jgi:hypothetical protein
METVMGLMSDIKVVVMTVSRSPEYVHATLASLFSSCDGNDGPDEVQLMVGSPDAAYLAQYRHHRRIRICPVTESEWTQAKSLSVHRRFCHNYHRCLSVPLDGFRGLLICEDDIVVRDGFGSKLLSAVDEMEHAHGLREYLLACYTPYDLAQTRAFYRGRFYASYFAPDFYGTQSMYYPKSVVSRLADRMMQEGVVAGKQPGDMVVKDFGRRLNAIYGTVASLAQHIGRKSTGLGNFHAAPNFSRPFPEKEKPSPGAQTAANSLH